MRRAGLGSTLRAGHVRVNGHGIVCVITLGTVKLSAEHK